MKPKTENAEQKPGNDSIRKLQFFDDFLSLEGLTHDNVASMLSVTRPTVSHWFLVDDTRLSIVQGVIESLGYTFSLSLEKDTDSRDRVDVIDLLPEGITPKRLSFLAFALKRYGIGKYELAEKLNVNYTTIRYWFSTDDISFSWLHRVAEVLDLSIRITITKNLVMLKDSQKAAALPVVPVGKNKGAVAEQKSKRYYTVSISRINKNEL